MRYVQRLLQAVLERNKFAQDRSNKEEEIKRKRDQEKAENDVNKAQRVEALSIERQKVAVLQALAAGINAPGPAAGVPQQQQEQMQQLQQQQQELRVRLNTLDANVNQGFAAILARLPPLAPN